MPSLSQVTYEGDESPLLLIKVFGHTSPEPALAPWTTTLLSSPWMKLLKTFEMVSNPAALFCGIKRPTKDNWEVDPGNRLTEPELVTGAIMTSPTNVLKPIELSWMPT